MPDLAECIRRFHEAQATRPPDRPIRVIRVAMLRTTAWRSDARKVNGGRDVVFPSTGRAATFFDQTALRCQVLAETGELLGVERVGLVVEAAEVGS